MAVRAVRGAPVVDLDDAPEIHIDYIEDPRGIPVFGAPSVDGNPHDVNDYPFLSIIWTFADRQHRLVGELFQPW